MIKNVTISIDEESYRKTRVEAARAGKSMSRYIADTLHDVHSERPKNGGQRRNPQLDALKRMLAGPPLHIAVNGRMPTVEERNKR